jgi:hypothetical protein
MKSMFSGNKFETMLLKVDTEDKELIILGDLTLI